MQFCCSAISSEVGLLLSFHQNNRFLVDLSPNTHCCFPFFHFPSLRLSLLPESLLLIFVLGITEFQNPKLSQSLHSVTLFSFLSTISSSLPVITLLFHFPDFCLSSPLLSSLPERKKKTIQLSSTNSALFIPQTFHFFRHNSFNQISISCVLSFSCCGCSINSLSAFAQFSSFPREKLEMVDIVISVAAKVAECLVDPIARQLGYLFNYRRNYVDLTEQIEMLDHARVRLQQSVEEANRQGDEIFPDVQEWLKGAERIIQKKEDFIEDGKKASKSCFYLKSRYQLSKQAKKQAGDIVLKIQQAHNFGDRVSYRPSPPPLPFISSASFKDYEAFQSRESTFNQIMQALRNENMRMIGVWGMGGVGKTTLVKQVAQQAREDKLFHEVVMASDISQTPNIAEIQGKIANMLGLKFEAEEDRAGRLRQRLKGKEKILVIFDDIWGKLDLRDIGIPDGDDHKGCKVLLTSREHQVLSKDMRTQKEFHLQHLSEDEAWNLFRKTAGDSVENPELRPIAVDVAKKCDGLPVEIVTIANALRGESVHVWENALEELRRSAPTNIRGVTKNVYKCLELSYNHLESDEVKSLFLLCALLGDGDISMDRLLQFAMCLNLFERIYSWEKAMNKLFTLVENLKVSSLLLDHEGDGDSSSSLLFDHAFVRMHDVVRDVARSIASKDPHRFVVREAVGSQEAVELREWQRTDECRNCTRISLICRNMDELPQGLVCPQLEFFLLNSSNDDKQKYAKIPDAFFQDTKQLRILDLSKVSLTPSPSSLGFLSNLQTLRLNQCQIQDITVIGELKKLQVLSLAGSNIKQLPNEVAQLSDLRMLDLRDCYSLKVIPRNVISSLSQLEYLSMEGSEGIEWEAEGFNRGERINACLSELKHLSSLRTLELQLSNLSLFPEDGVPFENLNLTRYSIVISPYRIRNDEYKASSRRLVFQGVTSLYMVKCFSKLLKRSQVLDLGELDDTKHVVYELDKEGFVELKYLTLSGCPTVQYILHSSTSVEWVPPPNTFCMLEELILDGLDNLEAVCHGPIPMGSFGNLRILRLESCERLKYVFSLPTQHGRESAFPQLQHLELSDLPELISFYSTRCSGTQESMTFFSQQAAFPALESLRVRRLDNLKALWHNQLPTNSFSKLKGLELIGCDELLNVFPLSVAKVLVQLEDLKISFCEVLEAIVANENEDEATSLFLFPRLTSLTLNALPQLQRFCFGRFTSRWPLLKELEVWDCDKVEILFQEIDLKSELDNKIQQSLFLVEKVALPNLESLFVGTLDNIRALRPDQLPANSFSKLRKLEVILCNKLLNLFPLSVASALVQLEDLWISWSGVEAIVANENEDEAAPLLLFPNLTSLTLRYLHQLKRFCSGRFSSSWSLLKKLEVDNCDKVEILFQQIGLECELEPLFWVEQVAFPSLESLFVCNLHNIRALWPDQLPANSFSKLRKLRVSKCNKLLNLFSLSVASALMQLEDLHISGGEVEAIVTNENEDEAAPLFLFPNLTSLTLRDLHQLKRFCSGRFSSSWPLLKKLEVLDCDKVEILFQQISLECELEPLFWVEQVALPGLESLYTDGLDNIRALCLDQLPANSFSKLRKLQVRGCNKLLNLFPVSVASALVQLEDLYISASGVEAIVANENEDEASPLLLFPNLTSLTLFSLHQLKRFCSGRFSSSWPLLKELEVVDCDKVEILFQQINLECELEPLFWVEQEAFPNLEELTLSLKGTVEIWRGQFSRVSFSKLSVLTIKEYHGISVVIPSNMVQILHNLEKLEVRMCDSVNEVIQVEIVGNDGHELIDNEIEFTRLKSLTFYHLPNLKSFCSSTRYVFKFPSLETMKVGECHGMEFFCKGVLNAPRLKSVQDEFFRRILAR